MPYLKRLKAAKNLHDIANLLGVKPRALSYILYVKPATQKYQTFEIPKKMGGFRTILAPHPDLKLVQRRLADLLQSCISEINAEKGVKTSLAHGFKRGYSIMTNAFAHRGRRYILNIDLKDFFPSINFGRVRGFFISNKNFLLDRNVATLLAQIACHQNALPQGSPCSPVISNLIGHILDIRLAKLAYRLGCSYSRYADDITFSTGQKTFPKELAMCADEDKQVWQVGNLLESVVTKSGFRVNSLKTRVQYRQSRQEVTGLTVNSKVNTRVEYRNQARAMLHRLLSTGEFFRIERRVGPDGALSESKNKGSQDYLSGVLGFINSIHLFNEKKRKASSERNIRNGKNDELSSFTRNYQKYFTYKHFLSNQSPVIICEGKTDNVYLRSAIKRLTKVNGVLGSLDKNGAVSLKVSFFKRTKTTDGLFRLTGGVSQFKSFVNFLIDELPKYLAPKAREPVIFVIDNDEEASGIYSSINNKTDQKVDKHSSLIKISKYLYVVPTPLGQNGEYTTIEYFFEDSVLNTKLGGKSFNRKNEGLNSKAEYGKAYFATHVVHAKEASINFDRFKPLLQRIELAISASKE